MLRELGLFSLEKERLMRFYLFLDISNGREYRCHKAWLSGIQWRDKSYGHKKDHFKIAKTFILRIIKDQNKLSMAAVESPPTFADIQNSRQAMNALLIGTCSIWPFFGLSGWTRWIFEGAFDLNYSVILQCGLWETIKVLAQLFVFNRYLYTTSVNYPEISNRILNSLLMQVFLNHCINVISSNILSHASFS